MIRTESHKPQQLLYSAIVLIAALAVLFVALFSRPSPIPLVESPQAAPQLMAKESDGLLRVTAEHLSKLEGGASVGGFPGFEPPDDDERYKRKVKDSSYSGEEANTWLKEIINYLRQLIKRYPGKTLAEILKRHGLSEAEIDEFIKAVREAYNIAGRLRNDGVRAETITALQELLPILGIPLP